MQDEATSTASVLARAREIKERAYAMCRRAVAAQHHARELADDVGAQCLGAQRAMVRNAFAVRRTSWQTYYGARGRARHPLTGPVVVGVRLAPERGSFTAAMRLFDDLCPPHEVGEATYHAARLVLAELVANAIRHAGTRFDLWIRRTGRHVAIAVGDDSPAPPILSLPDPAVGAVDRPGGRGVWIVAHSAADWGYFPTAAGKVVWAVL